jgi:hypothetical protein
MRLVITRAFSCGASGGAHRKEGWTNVGRAIGVAAPAMRLTSIGKRDEGGQRHPAIARRGSLPFRGCPGSTFVAASLSATPARDPGTRRETAGCARPAFRPRILTRSAG